jgi:hypothetical protein
MASFGFGWRSRIRKMARRTPLLGCPNNSRRRGYGTRSFLAWPATVSMMPKMSRAVGFFAGDG